jgi:hypothetical protein
MLADGTRRFLLEESDPSVRYLVYRDLYERAADDPDLREAREAIGREGWAARILADQREGGYWESFEGDPDQLYGPKYIATNWRLLVLSDLGASRSDPRIDRAARLLLRGWSGPDGPFGEAGSEVCITGNAVRMLVRFGFSEEPAIRRGIDWLVDAQKPDGGWHCFPSPSGTLDAWEALAAFAVLPGPMRTAPVERAIERGAAFYLDRGLLKESDGSTYPPWERLHYPHHYYYDLLVGLDALTALGYGSDPRIRPALDRLEAKRGADGRWRLEAVHPDLLPDDPYHPGPPIYPMMLEHVGVPSRWATALALRALRRAGRV